MMKRRRDRDNPTVSAGSMADIAFLLLIFFLVTTTIDDEKGLRVILPEWSESIGPHAARNTASLLVNGDDQILFEKEKIDIELLDEKIMDFVLNPKKDTEKARSPEQCIISFQNHQGTSYGRYIEVYDQVKASYRRMWEDASQRDFQKEFIKLSDQQKFRVKRAIPMVISEAEPTDAH